MNNSMIDVRHLLWIIPLTSLINVTIMSILFVGKESEKSVNAKEGEEK